MSDFYRSTHISFFLKAGSKVKRKKNNTCIITYMHVFIMILQIPWIRKWESHRWRVLLIMKKEAVYSFLDRLVFSGSVSWMQSGSWLNLEEIFQRKEKTVHIGFMSGQPVWRSVQRLSRKKPVVEMHPLHSSFKRYFHKPFLVLQSMELNIAREGEHSNSFQSLF